MFTLQIRMMINISILCKHRSCDEKVARSPELFFSLNYQMSCFEKNFANFIDLKRVEEDTDISK